ncbi:ABC transporter substrate-binding protein [Streptomyces sp. BI20]|uniref:ABC transporter substrate-binding protein n=1 Tax=Streptomyces sp. BI20 TaxID=3403460 RepID=UPI003C73A84A
MPSRKLAPTALLSAALLTALTACGSADKETKTDTVAQSTDGKVAVGAFSGGAAKPTTLEVEPVEELRAQLPKAVRDKGELVIAVGALPTGYPPLSFVGDDHSTLTGNEPDLGRLVAATLGLKPVVKNSTWENVFVGLDSGRVDVAFTNVTVTEERKRRYDFATYRKDNLVFEVRAGNTWNFDQKAPAESLAGRTVAVSRGTNQEKILLEWQKELQAKGKDITIKYFPDLNSTYLALDGGRIDILLGPGPALAHHVANTKNTPKATRVAGEYSGAGASLQGLIGAATKKDGGLVKPVAGALEHLQKNGQYAKLLETWSLGGEAVPKVEINPPGLPLPPTS